MCRENHIEFSLMLTIALILLSILLIIVATTRLNLHPFLALLVASLFFGISSGMGVESVILAINDGFGGTIGKIGIIIAGILIGTFLEKTGGAFALANVALKIVSKRRVHTAMGLIGYLVSIPVFADSGFIILSSLNKALTRRAGLSIAGTAVALSLGLIASHTMVPPTPGPIAAAGLIGADLGKVILLGIIVSLLAMIPAIRFASYMGRKVYIDPMPGQPDTAEQRPETPPAWKAFLPILVPIVLIILRSVADYPTHPLGEGKGVDILIFLGNPVVALLIGLVISLSLPKKLDRHMLSTTGWAGEALQSAALIILVTGAGGAFGNVLQQSDIGEIIREAEIGSSLGLWLPFLIAVALTTAQGSSTVAIITTASLIAPLIAPMGLDSELSKAMVVIAIGAGAGLVSHANDSFFWVVTQLSGMNVNQGYRLHSLGTVVVGLSAMLILFLLSLFV